MSNVKNHRRKDSIGASPEEKEVWKKVFDEISGQDNDTVTLQKCVEVFKRKNKTEPLWLEGYYKEKLQKFFSYCPIPPKKKMTYTEFLLNVLSLSSNNMNDDDDDDDSSSDEEAETMQQIFAAMDKDNDGYITLDDMVETTKEQSHHWGIVFDIPKRREELEYFVKTGDLDRDGRLSLEEFVIAMKKRETLNEVDFDSDYDAPSISISVSVNQAEEFKPKPKKPSRKQKLSRRLSKQHRQLYKVSGLDNGALWLTKTDEKMDYSNFDDKALLRQMFDLLDEDHVNYLELSELLRIIPHIRLLKPRQWNKDRRLRLQELYNKYASLKPKELSVKVLSYNDFCKVIADLDFTKNEFNATWSSVCWNQSKASTIDLSTTSIDDMDTALNALKGSVLKFENELVNQISSPRSPRGGPNNEPQLLKQLSFTLCIADALRERYQNAMATLSQHSGVEAAPPLKVGTGKQKSAAERNQEFFYITALAVKLNLEAQFRKAGKEPPRFVETRKLYELAMRARVPFQFYYLWIDRQLNPTTSSKAKKKKKAKKINTE